MSKSGYDFYLDKCLLPITPSSLQIKIKNANKTITLIDEGQINILKKANLTEISFECIIPQVSYPFSTYKNGFKNASYFLTYFETLKNWKRPFQFIVSRKLPSGGKLFNTNIKVSLEDYTIKEDSKQGFDLVVKINLKQYRQYGTKTVKVTVPSTKPKTTTTTKKSTTPSKKTTTTTKKTTTTATKPKATVKTTRTTEKSPAPVKNKTYKVKTGDCLWNIAKYFYGDGSKYMTIYNANPNVFKGRSPNLIYTGEVLTIPAKA